VPLSLNPNIFSAVTMLSLFSVSPDLSALLARARAIPE